MVESTRFQDDIKTMVEQTMPFKLQALGLSDIGLVRQNNEDVWAIEPSNKLYILADGMGGHQAGEVAARETVSNLCERFTEHLGTQPELLTIEETQDIVAASIEEVNAHVYKMGRKDRDLRGMGTTLCCLHFHPKGLIYAHVGDSRIYRLRNKKLSQLTKDHSLLRELMDSGQIDELQAGEFVYKNIITKAVGTEPFVQPTVRHSEIKHHDILLMCTDGLSDLLSRDELEGLLNKRASLSNLAQSLVETAKERGGHDNITVVLVKVTIKNETKDLSR